MIIEDPDAFKSWLTTVLEPLCDADPGALAKYVFALVKKDKPNDALRESMIDQLEVFLQDETKPFVELLFKTLETQEYNLPLIPNANPPNPNIIASKLTPVKQQEPKEIIPVSELPSLNPESMNGSATTAVVSTTTALVKKDSSAAIPADAKPRDSSSNKTDSAVTRKDSEKEDLKPRRRSRHRSLSRNRSRSRSWDRSRRSRSREKSRDRDRPNERLDRDKRERGRTWRNKSPPRRYDRRRSRSGSPGRLRSRSRSPRHTSYRGRYRNRSPPRSDTRSRSRSADRKDRNNKDSGAATPTQDSNHGDTDMRLTSTTQSIQSVVAAADSRTPGTGPASTAAGAAAAPGGIKRRCRDFDEKGYCMRGEMCPFDHGIDPVVLEDTALTRVLTFGSNGAPATTAEAAAPAPLLPGPMMHNPPLMPHHMPPRQVHPEYNPQAPAMWHRPGFRGPRPPIMGPRLGQIAPYGPNMQRELISVPVMDNQSGQDGGAYAGIMGRQQLGGIPRNNYMMQDEMQDGILKKKQSSFDFNRLGPRNKNPVNCSLELKKVPQGLNNIMHLNNHFSKFGKIVNIQVNYEGDPEAAIVTFSSHAEANAAYRSTEAVLNNRFIKVFWHSSANEGKQENVPPRSVKDRLGQVPTVVAPNANKVLNLVQPKATTPAIGSGVDGIVDDGTGDKMQKSALQKTKEQENKAQVAAAIKKNQELLAAKEKLKKNQEEKKKDMMKITQDLRKRKQDLLEKQLASQKLLIEKLEKTPAGPQREILMETIKKSQAAIELIRKDMLTQSSSSSTTPPAKAPPHRKSKEEAQKEVLDAELDLISKQAEGADTSELQKKLVELKARASSLSRTQGPPVRGGRVSKRFHPTRGQLSKNNHLIPDAGGKKKVFQKHAVDHRPTRLLVSGYEGDEQQSVLAHFAQFGEISDYVTDEATPSIVLNFKTRKEAEVAVLKGKNFQDRTLSVTWCNAAQLNSQISSRSSNRTVLLSETDDEHLLDMDDELMPELSEETLLQDDEEEDEENEDRSWRR